MRFDKKSVSLVLMRLVVLSIPIQLGFHFWPPWAQLLGRRIDYLSPTIYFTDCLLIIALVSWFFELYPLRRKINTFFLRKNTALMVSVCIGIAIIALNVTTSISWQVSLYRWIKLVLFGFITLYIATHQTERKQYVRMVVVGAVFSSLIAIVQFGLQHSIGGIFWFVGERFFTIDTPLIARAHVCVPFTQSCSLFLRSYGTFAHSNVLAGYLLVALFLFVTHVNQGVGIYKKRVQQIVSVGVISLFLIALGTTMSRAAIMVVSFLLLWWHIYWQEKKNHTVSTMLAILFTGGIIIGALYIVPLRFIDESVVVRQKLNTFSTHVITGHALYGVGLGNFTKILSKEKNLAFFTGIQPVHNVYLLAVSELGLVGVFGLIAAFIGIWKSIEKKMKSTHPDILVYKAAIIAVGILGMVDHYVWTLQQGQLLFFVLVGLFLSSHTRRV